MEIGKIKDVFSVRKLNQEYVNWLTDEFKENGYQAAYPVSVTKDGVMWDGAHRLAACKALQWAEIPSIEETPDNLRRAAHERNRAASSALPETFVDHAEEIWEMLAGGMTQQAVAVELGISRTEILNFSNLQKICDKAWEIIDTTVTNMVSNSCYGLVSANDTVVSFTERLLREITNLTECHQIKIVSDLASGNISKKQFKNLANEYKQREWFAEYVINNLDSKTDVPVMFQECLDGGFSSLDQVKKAVIHANEKYANENMIQVIQGDCLIELKKIKQESFDLLLTDPPYHITQNEWDDFKSKEEFINFTKQWLELAVSKVKSTGKLYICWSQRFMFDFPFKNISERFVFGNTLIWNYKNNIKPNNRLLYKYTYEPIFYFYGVDAESLNMPKNIEWDESHNDYDVFTIAQPQTNFKSDKKQHPTQKPKQLFSQLIECGSSRGDKILDCFAGSGTTGICAKELNRKAVLIEKESKYVKIIKKQI